MSNQVAMTFESAIIFDKAFVEDRLNECLSLLKFQSQRCLDGFPVNADLCAKALESFQNFSRYAEPAHGFTLDERREFFDRYFDLKNALKDLKNAEQPKVRQVNDSVAQPVAPTQLSVLRVLGQVSKAATEREERGLSLLWFPTLVRFPAPTKFLSNTRPVGGLA